MDGGQQLRSHEQCWGREKERGRKKGLVC
jgi:hypothetical protein